MIRRIKTGTMMFPKIIKLCDDNLDISNATSRNDFIEQAIQFYVGYLHRDDNTDYLNPIIDQTINNKIDLLEEQLSTVLFKLSVEVSMMMQIIAVSTDIDKKTLELLRNKSTEDVQASIGKINLKDVISSHSKEGEI